MLKRANASPLGNGLVVYVHGTAYEQGRQLGAATADGKTYLAKTRDLSRGPVRQLLVHREFDDGSYRNEIQSAGQLTLPVGVNSYGVAVGTSGQWSKRVVVDLARGDAAWHIPNLQPVLRNARTGGRGARN